MQSELNADVTDSIEVSRKFDGYRMVTIMYSSGRRDVMKSMSVPLDLLDLVGVQGNMVRQMVRDIVARDHLEFVAL